MTAPPASGVPLWGVLAIALAALGGPIGRVGERLVTPSVALPPPIFHEVAEEVLSGAREDEATFPTDGQDPDDFARNIFDLRDTIADELKRGKWRNVVRADRPRAPPFSSEAVR